MSFTYYIPTRILFGKDALNDLSQCSLPGTRALVVITSGKSMRETGTLDRVCEQLRLAGAQSFIYNGISPNPTKAQVMEGAAMSREHECDFIVGLGGGSAIDAAKAIAIMAVNPGDLWDYFSSGTAKAKPIPNAALPLIAIATTAGTGTEADPFMVVTNTDTSEKQGFGTQWSFPVISVVDHELMRTIPADYTAYQGFDALFHATEGYLNTTANDISDMYAIKAIELIAKYLPRAVADGNDEFAREKVALGSTLAGMVESTSGCISAHALEHPISCRFPNVPHGAGLIMICLGYYSYIANMHCSDERMINMARAMGKRNADTPLALLRMLDDLMISCGVADLKMSSYGITPSDTELFVNDSFTYMRPFFSVDPMDLSYADCIEIMRFSYK